jgi:hypothetical protein
MAVEMEMPMSVINNSIDGLRRRSFVRAFHFKFVARTFYFIFIFLHSPIVICARDVFINNLSNNVFLSLLIDFGVGLGKTIFRGKRSS